MSEIQQQSQTRLARQWARAWKLAAKKSIMPRSHVVLEGEIIDLRTKLEIAREALEFYAGDTDFKRAASALAKLGGKETGPQNEVKP